MREMTAINGPAAGTLGRLIEGRHSGSMSSFVDNDDLNDLEKRARPLPKVGADGGESRA
jgi:hypothetical protein